MNQPEQYQAIEAAIVFLQENHRLPPSLEAVAAHVHLSPAGLQQLFGEWAGVGPGPFLHYLVPGRRWLPPPQAPLFAEAPAAGLSAPGRPGGRVTLHAMTPGEYGKGGQPLEISYTFSESPFGPLLAAATPRGLCYAGFADDPARAAARLSVVSTVGYLAFIVGPPLLGLLGDHVGVLRSLLLVGLLAVPALFAVPAVRERASVGSD